MRLAPVLGLRPLHPQLQSQHPSTSNPPGIIPPTHKTTALQCIARPVLHVILSTLHHLLAPLILHLVNKSKRGCGSGRAADF